MTARDKYAVVDYELEVVTRLDVKPAINAAFLATRTPTNS